MKSAAGRGIGAGLGVFLALAGLAYLTPARVPVMEAAGRDYTVLQYQLQARQQALDLLQPQGSGRALAASPPAVERARAGVAAAQTRIGAWQRLNSVISPFGFLGWVSDLWPWLLGLGLALPALGGLVGAQLATKNPEWGVRHPPSPSSAAAPPSLPSDPEASGPSSTAPPTSPSISPFPSSAPFTEVPPSTAGSEPATWNWNARPAARATPARPKPPPVKSPHGSDGE
jgi:hypothetical protein